MKPIFICGFRTLLQVQSRIKKGDKIAQIFFEQLSDVPEHPYDQQQNASFNEEDQYRGMAEYKDEYEETYRRR